MIKSLNFQPVFKGTVEAGPIKEKSSMPQDGVLIGYTMAALEKGQILKKDIKKDSVVIEALIDKIKFPEIINVKGFEDISTSKEARKVIITANKDSFELKYNFPQDKKWFDYLTWGINRKDKQDKPSIAYLDMFLDFVKKHL
ncbi:MAG: hypothetical protein AB1782_07145 [Cyanobacteriota bacterium]